MLLFMSLPGILMTRDRLTYYCLQSWIFYSQSTASKKQLGTEFENDTWESSTQGKQQCQFDSQVSKNMTEKLFKKLKLRVSFSAVDLNLQQTKKKKKETIFDVL